LLQFLQGKGLSQLVEHQQPCCSACQQQHQQQQCCGSLLALLLLQAMLPLLLVVELHVAKHGQLIRLMERLDAAATAEQQQSLAAEWLSYC
jgi:hypothetical protein